MYTWLDVLRAGVILCKLINCAPAETTDLRAVHTGHFKPLSVYEVVENLNMAINAAGADGLSHEEVKERSNEARSTLARLLIDVMGACVGAV